MTRSAPRIPRTVPTGRKKPNPRRQAAHLGFIREIGICLACGARGYVVAMHVRRGTDGGIGMKPSDKYTVPGCQIPCHDEQHRRGEVTYWGERGVDAVSIAAALWSVSGNLDAGRRIIERSLLTRGVV